MIQTEIYEVIRASESNDLRPVKSIMFDVCAEIDSREDFEDLSVDQLLRVMRRRLDQIEKDGSLEAFGYLHEYEVD